MKLSFQNRASILVILAVGGLIGFLKEIVVAVQWLYGLALTPHGAAALLVGTFLLAASGIVVALLRR